jgi:hypothetical protein
MNEDTYAEWLRRQGHLVVRTSSSFWHSESLGVYQALPYHWLIEPSEAELAELFTRHRAVAVRYSMPSGCRQGCASHSIVFEGGNYGFESLGYRTRKNVRRGLRNCTVEPMSFERLIDEGWELRLDTLDRQGRHLKINCESWRKKYLDADNLNGFEAWGAFVSNRLAAYLVTFQMDDCIYIVEQQSHRDYLDLNVNNAITFVASQNAAARAGVRLLFYGLESLDAPGRVSDFKFHMGYTAKPIHQRVVFHPRLTVLANEFAHTVVHWISKWLPTNRRLSKAEGMLRFCLAEKASSS